MEFPLSNLRNKHKTSATAAAKSFDRRSGGYTDTEISVLMVSPVYVDVLGASYLVTPLLGAGVHAGVEVRVVEDDGVGVKHRPDCRAAAVGEDAAEHLPVPVELLHVLLQRRSNNKQTYFCAYCAEIIPSEDETSMNTVCTNHRCSFYLSLVRTEAFVDADVSELPVIEEGLEDVQHLHHLSEDEHTAAVRAKLLQQDGESLEFTFRERKQTSSY